MGIFGFGKKKDEESYHYNSIGEKVYEFEDDNGISMVKKINISDFLYSGEEWCPDCHTKMRYDSTDEVYVCEECGYSITEEESKDGEGHPSYNSTFEDDY